LIVSPLSQNQSWVGGLCKSSDGGGGAAAIVMEGRPAEKTGHFDKTRTFKRLPREIVIGILINKKTGILVKSIERLAQEAFKRKSECPYGVVEGSGKRKCSDLG